MEVQNQIKKYRLASNLSQEDLAEKVFVTRQTISNWETGKNYPDLNSLVRLSTLFGVSLDILVKGDLQEMKAQIQTEDIRKFNRDGAIFTGLMLAMLLSAAPLLVYLGYIGIAIWVVLTSMTLYYAIRVERQKKRYDIQTYKEIVAFTEGKRLDEIEKAREFGKRPYQKLLLSIASALIALIVMVAMMHLLT
ncbi:MAG: helix-turn-helix transcriptional regulator [Oscillospiraceae bacterium]|nr:helix-turn-helix transcriptional regulator [Oscillospiraceae bacterium]